MPHVETLTPKKHSFANRMGQRPLTKFKDYRQSIKVKLIKHDDPVQMMKGTYKFAKATWADSPDTNEHATEEQMQDAMDQMLGGKALGLGLETVNFMFEIGGISHIDAQQITRQRIGVTFSAQCTGDRFLNHNDVLVEECIAKDDGLLKGFIDATLQTKQSYANMVDNGISIQSARCILPRNIETFYYMNTNLMTLLFFYSKRIDDGSQTWQMNEISRQMEAEVCKVFPQLQAVFDKHKTSFKFQAKAGADRKNTFSTALYIPKVDEYDYHTRDFLYDQTKEAMHYTNTPIKDRFFWGNEEVSEERYLQIKKAYDALDNDVHENHYTNDEVKALAEKLNQTL